MTFDVRIEDARWNETGLETVCEKVFQKVLTYFDMDSVNYEADLLACDDAEILALNQQFRNKSTATNVLSWPSRDRRSPVEGVPPNTLDAEQDSFLGDIAISYETCLREAQETQKDFEHHFTHLLVHGLLHLLGFDHEYERDARIMEKIETEILGKMGIDAPY